jgi:U3 small nucleolar RNA-associated protein 18
MNRFAKLNPVPDWVIDASNAGRGLNAQQDSSDDSDGDGAVDFSAQPLATLLRSNNILAAPTAQKSKKKKQLRPEVINIQRLKNIAPSGPSATTSLQIHPSLPFLAASGPSGQLDIYHLHPTPSDHAATPATSLFVPNTPLTTTSFSPRAADARVFLAARRRHFHAWNLATGRVERVARVYGHAREQRSAERFRVAPTGAHVAFVGTGRRDGGAALNVLDLATLQWVAQARVAGEGGVADFAWWRDGRGVCVVARSGDVTEWSLEARRAVARWKDEGAVGTTTVALGGRSGRAEIGGDRWVAIGSASGVVNVYSRRQWLDDARTAADADARMADADDDERDDDEEEEESNPPNAGIPAAPRPLRTLDQLTTPVSHLAFSPCGQALCMASRWKRDALRLVHLPTASAFRNWPTAATPLGRVSAVAWGEVAGELRLVVGNEAGRVMCWEVVRE